MNYEAVIGLEVHAQLLTESKIFCSSSAEFGGEPNSKTDPVVLGMPGVLPVLNRTVVDFAIKMGLATDCQIAPYSLFARKHYFYPDLPKGYQISQYELPICSNGYIVIETEGNLHKKIGLNRIHMEEDAGKSIHDPLLAGEDSLIDLNRSGVPLIEIVSEPDLTTPQEAYAYLLQIKQLLTYLEICDGNMEEGSLRCDANISIRPQGARELGVKTEVKNMNSFRNVERALTYEIKRQKQVLEKNGKIIQETLLWDADAGIARPMRSKEGAHDYRYFPDPDLLPLSISQEWLNRIKQELPELPQAKEKRFIKEYQLPVYDAKFLSASKPLAKYYEDVAAVCKDYKIVSNWIMSDVIRILNEHKIIINSFPVKAVYLAELLNLILDHTISIKIAKTIFEEMLISGEHPKTIVEKKGLSQIRDTGAVETIVNQVIEQNSRQVEQFKSGKEKVLGYFVGQVMKETKGKADPALVNEILRKKLRE